MISSIPEKIFHYTNYNGLIGILSSKTLRASHFKYTNDNDEIYYSMKLLLEYCINNKANGLDNSLNIRTAVQEMLEKSIYEVAFDENINRKETITRPFIVSFCSNADKSNFNKRNLNNGLLSQWRAYGNKMGRYALKFDTSRLQTCFQEEYKFFAYTNPLELERVSYLESWKDYSEFQFRIATNVNNIICGLLGHKDPDKVASGFQPIDFFRYASSIKHPGFYEEHEVRVTCYHVDIINSDLIKKINKKIKEIMRTEDGKNVYIELFSSSDTLKKKFIDSIEEIIVGPNLRADKHFKRLKSWLKANNLNIRVRLSDIPYREWGA